MPALDLPLYANQPQRKIPGTDVIAVTVYASSDKTVRHYVLFDAEGNRLGKVSNHCRRLAQSAGYHLGHTSYDARRMEHFRNLAEAAEHLLTTTKGN